jgi:hypothetical protein
MVRLMWGSPGERRYETGVDRGVLYVDDEEGVPWNGLISVNEKPSGGEATPYYIDGFKYLNIASDEEFEATIEAYYSPYEFDKCDGTLSMVSGLFITQQPRRKFGLCYRTKLGNDTGGQDYSYKLHFIYNALAAPSARNNNTVQASVTPATLSWDITTTPPEVPPGFKPTSHFILDASIAHPAVVAAVENVLYGSDDGPPTLPTPGELVEIVNNAVMELEVVPNAVTGIAALQPSEQVDLVGDFSSGIYTAPVVSTRLEDVDSDGLYTLEA